LAESHNRFRTAVRDFLDKEIKPTAVADDEKGKRTSRAVALKLGQAGLIVSSLAHTFSEFARVHHCKKSREGNWFLLTAW